MNIILSSNYSCIFLKKGVINMIFNMVHPSGAVKAGVKVGFSWTLFFFGVFVPLFRGDIKWTLIMFVAAFVTFGLSWLVFPFIYNKIYTQDLLNQGFKPEGEVAINYLRSKGLVF